MRPPEFTGGNSSEWCGTESRRARFNEAAGIHRRKPDRRQGVVAGSPAASMRPPEFTGGNRVDSVIDGRLKKFASMRPPEFTGGNQATEDLALADSVLASMRPPEFTGGNRQRQPTTLLHSRCFNEAAGIHRRKLGVRGLHFGALVRASMRPPEFTGGNTCYLDDSKT